MSLHIQMDWCVTTHGVVISLHKSRDTVHGSFQHDSWCSDRLLTLQEMKGSEPGGTSGERGVNNFNDVQYFRTENSSSQGKNLALTGLCAPSSLDSGRCMDFISHKAFLKSFCKSQCPHQSVNLFFILVIVKDQLTDSWGS